MKKKKIINHLQSIYNQDKNLTKSEKDALLEAIRLINEKNEFDPAWIAVILQALGLGIDILQKGP
jgi:hypothetical protein